MTLDGFLSIPHYKTSGSDTASTPRAKARHVYTSTPGGACDGASPGPTASYAGPRDTADHGPAVPGAAAPEAAAFDCGRTGVAPCRAASRASRPDKKHRLLGSCDVRETAAGKFMLCCLGLRPPSVLRVTDGCVTRAAAAALAASARTGPRMRRSVRTPTP